MHYDAAISRDRDAVESGLEVTREGGRMATHACSVGQPNRFSRWSTWREVRAALTRADSSDSIPFT